MLQGDQANHFASCHHVLSFRVRQSVQLLVRQVGDDAVLELRPQHGVTQLQVVLGQTDGPRRPRHKHVRRGHSHAAVILPNH